MNHVNKVQRFIIDCGNLFSKKNGLLEFIFARESPFEISENKNLLKISSYTVFATLSDIHFFPKSKDPINQFLFGCWFYNSTKIVLQFVPEVLKWIEIWQFWRGMPPVDSSLFIKLLSIM